MRLLYGISILWQIIGARLIIYPSLSKATIVVYNENDTETHLAQQYIDLPAADGFGPRIPEQGFIGRLQLAKPDLYACSELDSPVHGNDSGDIEISSLSGVAHRPNEQSSVEDKKAYKTTGASLDGSLPTAVLVSRSLRHDPLRCTFEAKVLQAQAAGYGLVIVHDFEQGSLFKMGASTDSTISHPTVEIPLVLVTHRSGLALEALIAANTDTRGPEIFVDNQDPFVKVFVAVNFTMLMIISGFFLALVTCGTMMIVTFHRYLRRYETIGGNSMRLMPLPEVLKLPEVIVEGTSRLIGDSCPVCLDAYRLDDKLRGLPCGHAFHGACIIPWLTEGQRSCPICKERVELKPTPTPPASITSSRSQELASAVSAESLVAPQPSSSSTSSLTRPRWDDAAVGSSSVLSALSSPVLSAIASRTSERLPNEENRAGRERGEGRSGDRLPLLLNSRGSTSDGGSMQESSRV